MRTCLHLLLVVSVVPLPSTKSRSPKLCMLKLWYSMRPDVRELTFLFTIVWETGITSRQGRQNQRDVKFSNQCQRNSSWTNVHRKEVARINQKRHKVTGSSDGHSELGYFPNIMTLKCEIPVQRQNNYPYLNSKNDYVSNMLWGHHQVIQLKAFWRTVVKFLIIQIIRTDVK